MIVLGTICARAGSKGLKNKNLINLNGIPLICHSINHALKSKIFNDIVVSTDSSKIEKIALKKGIKSVGKRPNYLSNDSSSKIDVIRHAVTKYEKLQKQKVDIIIDLDVTSPLRNVGDILKAFLIFKSKNSSNLITLCESKKNPYFNMVEINQNKISLVKKTYPNVHSRQKAPKVYEMNASIYIWKKSCLFSNLPLFNKNTSYYEMPFKRSIDIDSKLDFELVKFFLKKNTKKY